MVGTRSEAEIGGLWSRTDSRDRDRDNRLRIESRSRSSSCVSTNRDKLRCFRCSEYDHFAKECSNAVTDESSYQEDSDGAMLQILMQVLCKVVLTLVHNCYLFLYMKCLAGLHYNSLYALSLHSTTSSSSFPLLCALGRIRGLVHRCNYKSN